MPESILINDGRRSASPDRRVTFGNIERYDIMTSNEMKEIKTRRDEDVSTINGNYPMTRLDNRIRKALMLGFTETQGDTVTYEEIVDFLLEFKVIVNPKLCNERQITAIIQSSFPKSIVKPSAKHTLLFLNIENRSDEVIKEELVRVTTEPIINPYNNTASLEASEWIKEENESDQSEDENEELLRIEMKRNENVFNEKKIGTSKKSILFDERKSEEDNSEDDHNGVTYTTAYEIEIDREANHKGRQTQTFFTEPKTKHLSAEQSLTIRDLLAATHKQTQEIIKNKTDEQVLAVKHESPNSTSRKRIKSPPPPSRKQSLSPPVRECAVDVPSSIDNKNGSLESCENKEKVNTIHSKNNGVSSKQTEPFVNNLGRSKSVQDMAKKFEQNNSDTSKSALLRKRSFTRSTDRSFVGSIRDRFRSKTKDKDKDSAKSSKTDNNDGSKKKDKKEEEKSKTTKNFTSTTITPKSSRTTTETVEKTTAVDPRTETVRKTEFGGSSPDVRSSFRIKSTSSTNCLTKTSSNSVSDVRASFRINSGKRATANVTAKTTVDSGEREKNSFIRSVPLKKDQSNEVRSSLRRSTHDINNDVRSSVRKPIESKQAGSQMQQSEVRSSIRHNQAEKALSLQYGRGSSVRSSLRTSGSSTPRSGASTPRDTGPRNSFRDGSGGVAAKRSNSHRSSQNSSNASTPNISRENSKTNIKTNIQKKSTFSATRTTTTKNSPSTQEKDLLRIAKAFKKATHEVDHAKDNIEKFMMQIATEDLEEAANSRLKLDDLYDHIRHRMILAKDSIFDGRRNDVTVEMGQYFDLLFKTIASNFDRIGCEILTNKITRGKICYLTHVKLVDYVDDLQKLSAASVNDIEEDDEDVIASYV